MHDGSAGHAAAVPTPGHEQRRGRLLLVVLLLLGGLAGVAAEATTPSVKRISGDNRYATAAAISAATFPDGRTSRTWRPGRTTPTRWLGVRSRRSWAGRSS